VSTRRTLLKALVFALLPLFAFASESEPGFQTAAKPLVVDVRDNNEYKSGHLPGAVNIPYTKLEKHLDELREANGVVLYCILGTRTRLAEQTLIAHHIPNLMHLDGGLNGWRQSGLQVRTGWGP
jgi:rhodanese-related sulfurtransferase